jgi:hypothetical protein
VRRGWWWAEADELTAERPAQAPENKSPTKRDLSRDRNGLPAGVGGGKGEKHGTNHCIAVSETLHSVPFLTGTAKRSISLKLFTPH